METLDVLVRLIEKETYSMVLSLVSVIVSLGALRFSVYAKKKPRNTKEIVFDLEVKLAKAKIQALDLPEEERVVLQTKLAKLEEIVEDFYANEVKNDSDVKKGNSQSGFISQEFMLYAVPAIIALSFTFALVYLLIANQASPSYQTPEILKTGITTIIGYYFGVAVKDKPSASAKSEELEELQKQVEALAASNKPRQQDVSSAGTSA